MVLWVYDLLAVSIIASIMFGTIRREYHMLRRENRQLRELVQRQRAVIYDQMEEWKAQWV